jgi:hypothetical protein
MRYFLSFIVLLITTQVYCQSDTSMISMAILKVNRNVDATINDKVVFTIKPNQDFIYDFDGHNAFIKTKESGYIPESLVKRTNKPFFKFTCPKSSFKIADDNELSVACERHNIKIQPLLDSIVFRQSESDFSKYWGLRGFMDGAAAEMYYDVLFNLINSWNDDKLNSFLSDKNETFLKDFCKTITLDYVTWPINRIDIYYKSNYPKSWIIIKRYK